MIKYSTENVFWNSDLAFESSFHVIGENTRILNFIQRNHTGAS
jgi:hypothetical protein